VGLTVIFSVSIYTCHHVYSGMKNYQLRCALAIVTSLEGAASPD